MISKNCFIFRRHYLVGFSSRNLTVKRKYIVDIDARCSDIPTWIFPIANNLYQMAQIQLWMYYWIDLTRLSWFTVPYIRYNLKLYSMCGLFEIYISLSQSVSRHIVLWFFQVDRAVDKPHQVSKSCLVGQEQSDHSCFAKTVGEAINGYSIIVSRVLTSPLTFAIFSR